MAPSIGVNLRVTGHSHQGGRKYMEDIFSVAYQSSADEKDLEYAFFGIFDGHGGREAAQFAKENLMDFIVKQKNFWSERDEDVLRAITDGFLATHNAMWSVVETWPRTSSGLPSTSGTTASVAFIRRGRIYVGHVGDSGIVLGYNEDREADWKAVPLTNDHKPESEKESRRIHDAGGKVVNKMGVPRVVWNRPKPGHKGPVRRSTPFDEVPFLAVARALGDLWSHNQEQDAFVVSPMPDVHVLVADASKHRCLILGTDGLWNVMTPLQAVQIVQQTERFNESCYEEEQDTWINPSHCLVEKALQQWANLKLRADNTSVVTLMLDPPGPPRFQVRQQQTSRSRSEGGRVREVASMLQAKMEPEASAAAVPEEEAAVVARPPTPPKEALPTKTVRSLLPEPVRPRKRPLDPVQQPTVSSATTSAVPVKKRLAMGENRSRAERGGGSSGGGGGGGGGGSSSSSRLASVQRELRSNNVPLRKRLRPSIAVK